MRGRSTFLFVALVCTLSGQMMAQSSTLDNGTDRKQMRATRIENGSIDVDGRLNDAVWNQAEFVSDFLQVLPIEFGDPEDKTEVAVLYDDDAIYIGARMYVKDPENLRTDLSRRDDRGLGEQIIISLDTYLDRRTAYGFGVTTAGVRFDRYNSNDSQHWDFSWDAVWKVRTSVTNDAWIAEFSIPFSQLRFNNTEVQTWGININRWRPLTTEDIFWVVIPRSETGFASRFGNLVGIEGVKPSRRLELLPYVASDGRFTNNYESGDPYDDGSIFAGRIGGDLKMGLGPNLTLDATFNPDFGQVEADPAEVNLSAYETQFSEKRPFFMEGSDLFNAIGPRYFYSRRIGEQPHGSVIRDAASATAHDDEWGRDFVDYPLNTTILGATKITGRLKSGTSVAALIAVTDNEYAEFQDTAYYDSEGDSTVAAQHNKVKVEPVTKFAVLRMKQDLGESGSTAGLILTGVTRDMEEDDLLAQKLTKEAYSGGIDFILKFADRTYTLYGHAGFSHVKGTESAILNKQLSSTHYFQRPDASHVEVDPSRTSLSGYTGGIAFEKSGGDHWLYEVGTVFDSPELELNDAGILRAADDIDSWADLTYRETRPGKHFRNYQIGLEANSGWNFDEVRQYSNIEVDFNGQWLNYWMTEFAFNYHFGGLDDGMTRGGPMATSPDSWSVSSYISNNHNAVTTYGLNCWYALNEWEGYGWSVGTNLSTRIGDRVKFSVSPRYEVSDARRQYIGTATPNADPSNPQYVFSHLLQSTLLARMRGSYFFSPDLSLEVYVEPYAQGGDFYNFGVLEGPGLADLIVHDSASQADNFQNFSTASDFDYRSFRSSMVLRWEFSPGSTAYLVWQRNMSVWDSGIGAGQKVRGESLFDGFSGDGADMVALKISYWIPVT